MSSIKLGQKCKVKLLKSCYVMALVTVSVSVTLLTISCKGTGVSSTVEYAPTKVATVENVDLPTPSLTPTEHPTIEEPPVPTLLPTTEVTSTVISESVLVSGQVTLWYAYQADSAEQRVLIKLIGSVGQTFPELTVDVLQIPFSEIHRYYSLAVISGAGPDVILAPNDDLGNWVRDELVLQLDSYLEGKLGKVSVPGVEGMRVDGKLYGVPESVKAVALYYNKSLVDAPPATTNKLMDMVKAGQILVNMQDAYHLFGWSGAFGGQLLDANNTCIADQGGWTDFMQYLVDLKASGAIFEPDYGKAEALFRQGEAAFFVNGPWALADYKGDLGDDLGVVPMPAGPIGPATPLIDIDGFYLNPNSQNVDAAIELALFLTNQESSRIFTDMAGHVPIRTDVTSADPLIAAFADASAAGYPHPQSEEFANFWGPFGDMFTKVLEGAVTPEEGVAEACAAMNAASGK